MGKMSENDTMKERPFGDLLHSYRLVIPEIQREYVWGDPAIGKNVLGHFFKDFLDDFASYVKWLCRRDAVVGELREKYRDLDPAEDMLQNKASQLLIGRGEPEPESNVGFVYAYFSGNRTNEDTGRATANLIDGQQRFTTYFLMLLHIAYRAGRFQEFKELVRPPKGDPGVDQAFDFNVRVLTHEFLSVLIDQIGGSQESRFAFSDMLDSTWYLQEYRSDVSIRSMTNALKVWDATWGGRSEEDAKRCYDYLLNNVKFMFFRIEAVQGEQLYISMNGRGRNLSQPEIMRAKVFRDAADEHIDARKVGELFENINDFFWRHRIKNELTADAGEKKFFRWVYLLWKYEVLSSAVDEDRNKALTDFQVALQTKTRAGKVEFNLDEDMFGKGAITFRLIQETYRALEHLFDLYGDKPVPMAFGSKIKKTLLDYLPSVLNSTDDNEAFQQDCFCLLPMLRFVIKEQDRTSDASLSRQLSLARYLHNLIQRRSIQKSVNDLVDKAVELAESFAGKTGGWLEFLGKINLKDAGRITPEDEILKAERLLISSPDSRLGLVELISEVEDYKLAMESDANIVSFLDLKEAWRTDVWDKNVCAEFRKSFDLIKAWFIRLDKDRQHMTEWLMYPSHRGYRLRGSDKISRFFKPEIFESCDLLKDICLFEKRCTQKGVQVEKVFDEDAKKFLKEFWPHRSEEKDAITLAAIALASSRIVRSQDPKMPSYDNVWANVQYWNTFYNHNAPNDKYDAKDVTSIGGPNFSLYFWHMDYAETNWRWSYPKACNGRLLACHKVVAKELDDMVKSFYDDQSNGNV